MNVIFHGSVQTFACAETSFDAAEVHDVRGLIDELGVRFGGTFREFLLGDETCVILVNGNSLMKTGGYDTPISSGDTVELFPFVTGG